MTWLDSLKARLKSNREYAKKFQFAAHDKIELIGQAAALHITLGDRLTDLDKAIRIIECYERALGMVDAVGMSEPYARIVREALAEAEKIKCEGEE